MATLTELVDKQQYDEHMRVVATVLENDATHATVCQHLADGLTDPANVEQMVQEIAKVNQRIKDIEAAFSSIDLELAAFDDLNLKDKEQALRLRPQWATLFNKFNQILIASHSNAADAVGFIQSYAADMLGDVDTLEDMQNVHDSLEGFVEKIKTMKANAVSSETSFSQLAEEIRLFQQVINNAIVVGGMTLADDLINAQNKVKTLNDKIDDIQGKIRTLVIAIVACAVGAVVAGVVAYCVASPVAAIISIGAAIAAVGMGIKVAMLRKDYNNTVAERDQWQKTIDELYEKQRLLKEYEKTVQSTDVDIVNLAKSVDVITNIWNYLDVDIQEFKSALETALASKVTHRFQQKIKPLRAAYTNLQKILDMYARGSVTQ